MTSMFRCYLVNEEKRGAIGKLSMTDLPAGEVLIRGRYSSLNYKDALAATGHPGVARQLPHIPGIDVAGYVEECTTGDFQPGEQVLVTGYELGAPRWGGWSEFVGVPAEWVVRVPPSLSLRDVMVLGTAGFTAAQGVGALRLHGITPEKGEILVTGASGGVGSIAVAILARLGYQVVAMTGKEAAQEKLVRWGASRVIGREQIHVAAEKPLLPTRWAGAIDTVGGQVLATVLKETAHRGCVATCGNVAGVELPLTVFPFILRGVKLDGIDSAMCPHPQRLEIWKRLAKEWLPADLDGFATEVGLAELSDYVEQILQGQIVGRIVVDLQG